MEMGLAGSGAIVAGASAGIGQAIAEGLAREGARVALLARRTERLQEVAEGIREAGGEAVPIPCDLTDREAVQRSVAAATEAVGGIDVLVTNAGGPPAGGFLDREPRDYETAFRLLFLSALWLCHESVPRMIDAGRGGSIVMVASGSVKQPIDGLILSNSIRAGIAGLSKSMANELGAHGIRVNVLCPGYTATDRLAELEEKMAQRRGVSATEVRREWAAGTPLRRIGKPQEIADLAVYLASGRASYITGTVIAADGGRAAGLL